MDRKRLLEQLIKHFASGNQSQFARIIGCPQGVVSGWIRRNTIDAERIKAALPQVSGDWLLTGDGDMLLSGTHPATHIEVQHNNSNIGGGDVIYNSENERNTSLTEIKFLKQQLESLQTLLSEKERLIKVLLGREQGAK